MRIEVLTPETLPPELVALGVPVMVHEQGPRIAVSLDGEVGRLLVPGELDPGWCSRHRFTGKVGQTLTLRAAGMNGTPQGSVDPNPAEIILVGVGDRSLLEGDRGLESLRRASAAFVRAAGQGALPHCCCPTSRPTSAYEQSAAAVAEGAVLASYRYDAYRTGDHPGSLDGLVIVAGGPNDLPLADAGATVGARVAESVILARDLVNEPPSSLTPERFADVFTGRFAGVEEVTVEVWDHQRIMSERLGGLLAVSHGSTQPPRLVRVDYRPADPVVIDGRVPHLALVGKGITFDSGGLSLKTATGMETMKTDMSGAAVVLSAVDAAAARGARIRITAFAPLTENMPGGSATKPGDVLTTRSGKTIEVLNTDAEGRLVLADGLTLAAEIEPDAIIDVATLTGAAVVALGSEIGGLFGNDDHLIDQVRAAGAASRRAALAPPAPGRLPQPHRVLHRRHAQYRAARRGRQYCGSPSLARIRGRRSLGPSRHRRPGTLRRQQPLPDQGRDRLRGSHAGRTGPVR